MYTKPLNREHTKKKKQNKISKEKTHNNKGRNCNNATLQKCLEILRKCKSSERHTQKIYKKKKKKNALKRRNKKHEYEVFKTETSIRVERKEKKLFRKMATEINHIKTVYSIT